MAGRARLRPRKRFAALLVLVLLAHALALHWLAQQLEQQRSMLRALATPMFTRLLLPAAPLAVPAPAAARATRKRAGITSIAKSGAVAAAARPASGAVASNQAAPAAEAPALPASSESAVAASTPDTDTPTSPAATTPDTTTPTSPASAPDSAPVAGTAAVTPTIAASAPTTAAASSPAAPSPGQSPALASWPTDTRLTYQLGGYFRGDLHGNARVQWQRQAGQYQTRVEIDLTLLASVTLTSQGDVTPQTLLPRIYEELRGSRPRTTVLGDNTITLNDGRILPRPDGVQDTASQFVELSHRFATGQDALKVGRSVSLWMARPGGVDLWIYDIVERETLQTPQLGPVDAFRLKPRPIGNPRGNITAEIWFAPSLQYLPVRIRVHMGESTYVDLLVDKIEQR